MKLTARFVLVLVLLTVLAGAALAAEVSEGQVALVQENRLFIRTAAGEPLSFLPMWVQEGTNWVIPRPIRTILPALEPGEMVRVTWIWSDAEEGGQVRRMQSVEILSPLEGVLRAAVARVNVEELVVRPKDEPGTVTLNPKRVLREGRSVIDPVIAAKLRELKPGMRITIRWAWDGEGRKRIASLDQGW